jgi:hypothetical protein
VSATHALQPPSVSGEMSTGNVYLATEDESKRLVLGKIAQLSSETQNVNIAQLVQGTLVRTLVSTFVVELRDQFSRSGYHPESTGHGLMTVFAFNPSDKDIPGDVRKEAVAKKKARPDDEVYLIMDGAHRLAALVGCAEKESGGITGDTSVRVTVVKGLSFRLAVGGAEARNMDVGVMNPLSDWDTLCTLRRISNLFPKLWSAAANAPAKFVICKNVRVGLPAAENLVKSNKGKYTVKAGAVIENKIGQKERLMVGLVPTDSRSLWIHDTINELMSTCACDELNYVDSSKKINWNSLPIFKYTALRIWFGRRSVSHLCIRLCIT